MGTTWILVGDASRARVFSFDKDDAPWRLLEEIEHPLGRARTSDLVSDRAGRQRQIGPPLSQHTDPAEQESHRFAERLSHVLQKGCDEHRFTRLVLVAPPRFLGYLRETLREPVARHVVVSLDKDYTLHDEKELRRLIVPHIPAAKARA
ncbi:MAG TPA: host attachment protein [Planctomycetota bacterium]|nr:host attachment protein [Planctomycetota bacterium]